MAWFKKERKELQLRLKMDVPKGLWYKSPRKNYWCWWVRTQSLCESEDGFHVRIGSTYFEILFDNNEFVELDKTTSKDPLHCWHKICRPTKDVMEKTKLKDAVRGVGKSKVEK
jgi:acetyl-CoA carboxylase carboxyl transferase subunit beta